jgi:hypothetical protein
MADEIVLTFNFEASPPADGLGEVFVALARDYKEATKGRVLVIKSIQSGSIIVALTDAAFAAAPYAGGALVGVGAVNAVATFAKNLKEWFGRAKSDEGRKRLYRRGKKAAGQRSVEAMITTAAKNGLGVRVGSYPEYSAAVKAAIDRGYITMHASGGYLSFTQAGAGPFHFRNGGALAVMARPRVGDWSPTGAGLGVIFPPGQDLARILSQLL